MSDLTEPVRGDERVGELEVLVESETVNEGSMVLEALRRSLEWVLDIV